MRRGFPDLSSEKPKLRAVSEMELHEAYETTNQEGNPSAEEKLNQSFNRRHSPTDIASASCGGEVIMLTEEYSSVGIERLHQMCYSGALM
ncbi:hypothetical protein UY3_03838 [Chelonia mydas]|uniref:Uncharacterized protein n=1 Tax=Chelonia mydas TaxID=8469 RepID=M7BP25_CHEMY|nr:hypothetical protein UY3_03838 [Chelonia mydas]